MSGGRIYLDHAATTPVDPAVLDAMLPFLTGPGGNPSSIYREGRDAHQAVATARERVAGVLGADPGEVVFTGSGSEGAALAIRGAALAAARKGRRHLVTTAVEHHCVLHTVQHLERHHGFSATYVPVNAEGWVDPADVMAAVRDDTAVVSVQYANNEVGTIQPVADLGARLHDHPAAFHTDAVQAPGSLDLHVGTLQVDLLSMAGHKIYAPKGVGALFVRDGVRLVPQIIGGAQERGRRAGTENVAFIVGLGEALVRADARRAEYVRHTSRLSAKLLEGLATLPGHQRNGPLDNRLPNNANACLAGMDSEALLLALDRAGIAASSGSACTSASLEPSHVLLAMGVPPHIARSSLRLTTGWANTDDHISDTMQALREIVPRLRNSRVAEAADVV